MASRIMRMGWAGIAIAAVLTVAACTTMPPVAQKTVPSSTATVKPMARIPSDAPRSSTVSDGGVQKISVDVSQGRFDPMVIDAKAGVPIEITFGQGQGCMAKVLMKDFGVSQDLTSGGAVVTLPPAKPGTYTFSCGMEMQFGELVVK
jgi:type IV pilus biogenesis protein CpaD/CtpE